MLVEEEENKEEDGTEEACIAGYGVNPTSLNNPTGEEPEHVYTGEG